MDIVCEPLSWFVGNPSRINGKKVEAGGNPKRCDPKWALCTSDSEHLTEMYGGHRDLLGYLTLVLHSEDLTFRLSPFTSLFQFPHN